MPGFETCWASAKPRAGVLVLPQMSYSTDNTSTPFFLGEGQHFKSWNAGCAGKRKSDPVVFFGFTARLYCLHATMQSARKHTDHMCRAKFLWVSCAQVGSVQGQACHRPVHLQILQLLLFLTMEWMLWIPLGHCQQCCLQDSVYSLHLNQLPDHCTGIVQSIRNVLVNKMPRCFTSQTSES